MRVPSLRSGFACNNTLAGVFIIKPGAGHFVPVSGKPTNSMKRFSSILIIAFGLALVGAGCGLTTTVKAPVKNANAAACVAAADSVAYAGQDGKNALELLQSAHQVDVSAQGFVNAIDGEKPGDRQFWAFYVNCKQAEVGAKDYVTKEGDSIEWKRESF